jgi:cell division protein FtsX
MRKNRGAITIITLITILFMLSFLVSTYIIIANRRQAQEEIKSNIRRNI